MQDGTVSRVKGLLYESKELQQLAWGLCSDGGAQKNFRKWVQKCCVFG